MQDNNETNNTSNTESDNKTSLNTTDTNAVTTPVVPEIVTSSDAIVAPVENGHMAPTVTVPNEVVPVHDNEVIAPVQNTEVPLTAATSTAKKQILTQYAIATVIILVMGAGLVYALEQQGRINTGIFERVNALINPVPAAAMVNGTKISKTDYDKNLTQLQTVAATQGADVTNESVQAEIKKQAIDVLVNTELLRQTAYAEGALVTDEQIEARYQEILTSIGGEEQLAAKMVELNITEAALRKDIEGEILIQGHLSKAVDTSKIAVSEDELNAAYAQISGTAAAGVTVPPLAEIKTQLEAQLKTNKEQELVNAYITQLREQADIEVLI